MKAFHAILTVLILSVSFDHVVYAEAGAAGEAAPGSDPSLVIHGKGAVAVNGCAYDKASLSVPQGMALIIPTSARVEQAPAGGRVEIFMEKTLHSMDIAPGPMHIKDARAYMGVATRTEGNAIQLGTFGEMSTRSGSATISLLLRIPSDIEISRVDGLTGRRSVTMEGAPRMTEEQRKRCYWYGRVAPGPDWQALASQPDGERQAEEPAAEGDE